ncbi:PH-like domain-containing protein [Rhodococcus sp. MEB064]|uniref:PH-like domain-containing protein n=1 Tax=Rhodococcus sp. MEB064 TaxID=1587522 RepID=UPI0005ACB32F|nr:hypothetical protein [Rhodococcus sp. MEB064]KIQ17388.1 transporter [Rhodococcus sp. MEB064]
MDRVLLVAGFLVFWAAMIALILWGWRNRQKRQSDAIGTLPSAPDALGDVRVASCTGLYVGSTLAPSWQNRIAVGDIGHRATGTLTRYETGILLERHGETDIWMPQDALRAIRTERGLAGKVMTKDGLLVVRWELPTGTEIDTGFRADDKSVYPDWVDDTTFSSEDEKETA